VEGDVFTFIFGARSDALMWWMDRKMHAILLFSAMVYITIPVVTAVCAMSAALASCGRLLKRDADKSAS
jgi:hypothetical protein